LGIQTSPRHGGGLDSRFPKGLWRGRWAGDDLE
jgi:hypothetical protein